MLSSSTLLRHAAIRMRGSATAGSSSCNNGRHSLVSSSMALFSARSFPTSFELPDPSMSSNTTKKTILPMVKIVATIGPKSEQAGPMQDCVTAGMNCMRLNFSHATHEEVELRCTNLQAAQQQQQQASNNSSNSNSSTNNATIPIQDVVTILLDTKGPELRTGRLANDVSGTDTVELATGATITLHASVATLPNPEGSTATDLLIDFPVLAQVLSVGRQVLLDDGAVVLTVASTDAQTKTVQAVVQNSGSVRSRAGVNLPLADTAQHLPALSDQDQRDIYYGMEHADIDVVAASFVQTAQHVRDLRAFVIRTATQSLPHLWQNKPIPLIVSKIETASALQHFDEILDASDGIMVARGDLGVEIPLQQVTNAQKEMIAACNAAGKPVIVATQMLESMTKAPRPTRAEVSDVTNAVHDGADSVMLSGETAKGKYPAGTIQCMREIIVAAEQYAIHCQSSPNHPLASRFQKPDAFFADSPQTTRSALAKAAVSAATEHYHCSALVVVTEHPKLNDNSKNTNASSPAPASLPGWIAAHRPSVPIFTICHTHKQARQLQLHRGIYPVLVNDSDNSNGPEKSSALVQESMIAIKTLGYLSVGDEVVVVVENGEGGRIEMVTVS